MPQFDTHAYIKSLGEALVHTYSSAGQATTPGLIGQARERAVRTNLESILPGGVGVGTGCVIDSEGNASQQIDVILYEEQFCPVFNVAEDVGYYPCESVIAVGSIKSVIGKKELGEIYSNISSVRRLNRFVKPTRENEPAPGKVEFRTYLDKNTRLVDGNWATIQNSSSSAQIYAFGLGQSFGAKPETMMKHTIDLVRSSSVRVAAERGVDCRPGNADTGSEEADVIQRVGLPGRYFPETRKIALNTCLYPCLA